MTDVTFTPNVTSVDASWLNPVNVLLNDVFDGAQTKNDAADAINAINGVISSGVGTGTISKGLSGSNVDNRTLLQSGNITITTGTDEITLDVDSVTSASNIGTGVDVFKQRTADDLEFKNIKAGNQVTIQEIGDDLVISSSGTPTGGSAVLTTFDPTLTPYTDINLQDLGDSLSTLKFGSVSDQQFFATGAGTWTKVSGTQWIRVELIGGGGGGGGNAVTANAGGGGGGGGNHVERWIDVTAVSSIDFNIGSGGAGVTSSTAASGGSTTFLDLVGGTLTAAGGLGGLSIFTGGAGSGNGGPGGTGSGVVAIAGHGGSSRFGKGGQAGAYNGTIVSSPAIGGAGGGGGGATNGASATGVSGAAGGRGEIRITEYKE